MDRATARKLSEADSPISDDEIVEKAAASTDTDASSSSSAAATAGELSAGWDRSGKVLVQLLSTLPDTPWVKEPLREAVAAFPKAFHLTADEQPTATESTETVAEPTGTE